MSNDRKSYRQFNTVSFEGRVFNAEIPQGHDFVSVTVISAMEDDRTVTVDFTNSNGIKSLFEKGALPNGRNVIVTGHISSVSETYTTKEGKVKMRTRPNIHLNGASLQLGYQAKTAEARPAAGTEVEVDTAPAY